MFHFLTHAAGTSLRAVHERKDLSAAIQPPPCTLPGRSGGIAGKRSGYGVGGNVSLWLAVGRSMMGSMEDEKPGGRSTTRCGGLAEGAAGRRPAEQKTTTWTLAFFASLLPTTTGRGLLLPL